MRDGGRFSLSPSEGERAGALGVGRWMFRRASFPLPMNLPLAERGRLRPRGTRLAFRADEGVRAPEVQGFNARTAVGRILTLTLSPSAGDREQRLHRCQLTDEAAAISTTQHRERRRTVLPLPAGEGRGEGETFNYQPCSDREPPVGERLSLTLDPSPAGRGKQQAEASGQAINLSAIACPRHRIGG